MTNLEFENGVFAGNVKEVSDLDNLPEEYRIAIGKIVASHVVNEITGAERFDEPSIALAPGAKEKFLACRIAMEEYGHHLKFYRLAVAMNLDPATLDHHARHSSIFENSVSSWSEFVVFKSICDLAEIIQVEDLAESTFLPLRELAVSTMPEERFHAGFGRSHTKELCITEEGRAIAQETVNWLYPAMLPFFGSANSKNNEIYRKWGIKKHTNQEMRDDYTRRVEVLVNEFGLVMPKVA